MRKDFLILVLVSLFLLEISLGGSGVWSENLLGFNLRKILFFLLFLLIFSIPFIRASSHFYIYAIGALTFYFIWGLFIPINYGNLSNSLLDFPALFAITFLTFLSSKSSKNVVEWIVLFSARCSLVLAGLHCLIAIVFYMDLVPPMLFRQALVSTFIREGELAIFTTEPSIRIFWASSSFMLIGYAVFFFRMVSGNSAKIYTFIGLCVHFSAILITDTRAFQLFMIIVPVMYFFFLTIKSRDFGGSCNVIFLYILLLGLIEVLIISLVNSDFLMYLGLSKPGEGTARFDQIMPLLGSISDNFFWGKGFGSSVEGFVRSDSAPWTYEMSILALIMKLGFFGVISLSTLLFMALWLPVLLSEVKIDENKQVKKQISLLGAAGIGYFVVVSSNPFLFSLVGFSIMLVIYSWYILSFKYGLSI